MQSVKPKYTILLQAVVSVLMHPIPPREKAFEVVLTPFNWSISYDYFYLRGLRDLCNANDDVEDEILSYRGFTDIAFNPKKSLNCKARSLALFVALGGSQGLAGLLRDRESLIKLMTSRNYEGEIDSLFSAKFD